MKFHGGILVGAERLDRGLGAAAAAADQADRERVAVRGGRGIAGTLNCDVSTPPTAAAVEVSRNWRSRSRLVLVATHGGSPVFDAHGQVGSGRRFRKEGPVQRQGLSEVFVEWGQHHPNFHRMHVAGEYVGAEERKISRT